jgi:hypothetical protein
MRLDKKMVAVGILSAGLLAAGASAYTASIGGTVTPPVAGYASVTATGATAVSVSYIYDTSNPPNLTGVTFVAQGDTHTATLDLGFNGAAMAACSGSGSYVSPNTTYTCSGLSVATDTLTSVSFAVVG